MISIFEVKKDTLSKDFEITAKDIKATAARKFLKELDARVSELGLDYEQCREAARMFKKGNFEGALKKIWGGRKVKTSQNHSNNGSVETYTYEVDGYATFTEKFIRNGLSYSHTITAVYKDNPCPSKSLGTIIEVVLKPNSYDFEAAQERANREAFMNRSTAVIYNILFVNFDGYDMTSLLSRFCIKLRNKL